MALQCIQQGLCFYIGGIQRIGHVFQEKLVQDTSQGPDFQCLCSAFSQQFAKTADLSLSAVPPTVEPGYNDHGYNNNNDAAIQLLVDVRHIIESRA